MEKEQFGVMSLQFGDINRILRPLIPHSEIRNPQLKEGNDEDQKIF
jgi:hypothetical protein